MRHWIGMLALLLLVSGVALLADDDSPAKEEPRLLVEEDLKTTRHKTRIGDAEVEYVATAGYMKLPDYEGRPRANLFYISYVREGVADASKRPVTFSFNGGPGSSSVWLHLGALGPRRVLMDDEGMPLEPPYQLVRNDHSWLDFTDLVFIDPVSTGYSRALPGKDPKKHHGLYEDVESVGEFIRLYLTRRKRWQSPKFLAGESYGTTRAAELSGHLQDSLGMYLNGIVLISPILNFQTTRARPGNDLPFWLYLPTYTATAYYHHRLDGHLSEGSVADAVAEAEAFARTKYLLALAKGDRLTAGERDLAAEGIACLIGVSKEFVLRSNLRVTPSAFRKELLRKDRKTVGRLDSRFKGIDRTAAGDHPEFDPSMAAIDGPYTACMNDYVRRELEYENDLVYEILTGKVHPWRYGSHENRYVNVSETLRRAMTKNRGLRVLTCSGYYDLATPYFAMDYTADHMELDPALRKNIRATYYESGHMMYIRKASLEKLRNDVKAFYSEALSGK